MPFRLCSRTPLTLALALALSGCALLPDRTATTHAPPSAINPGLPWPATDALGRSLPVAGNASGLKPDRAVGIFYFLWHDVERTDPAYNIATILAKDPDILQKPDSPLWAYGTVSFDFKWWDHAQAPGDIMDVYVSGDAAPEGRFNFRYGSAPAGPAIATTAN